MCEKLVGLGEVDLVGINDSGEECTFGGGDRVPQAPPVVCGMWRVGVVEGLSECGVGGFTGVRSACAAAVAETALDVPEHRLCAQVVHRTRPPRLVPNGRC